MSPVRLCDLGGDDSSLDRGNRGPGFIETLEDPKTVAGDKAHKVKKAQEHVGTMDRAYPPSGSHLIDQAKEHAEGFTIQVRTELEVQQDVSAT
jgi:hypothetical protein